MSKGSSCRGTIRGRCTRWRWGWLLEREGRITTDRVLTKPIFQTVLTGWRGGAHSAALAIETEDRAAVMDSLILCKFLRGVFRDFYEEAAELLAAVTGWPITANELHTVARRVVKARKCLNEREGWTRSEDTLPPRLLRTRASAGITRALPGAARHDDRRVLPGARLGR